MKTPHGTSVNGYYFRTLNLAFKTKRNEPLHNIDSKKTPLVATS